MEDDNWLNKTDIECPNCNKELLICDHSPFEHSYTMYCSLCPKRVDIGLYEPVYEDIKDYEKLPYEDLMIEFENRLENCECGGKYKLNSKRKCLHCSYPLELKEEQNVWLKGYWKEFESEEEEDRIEKKMSQFIVNPKWKK